MARCLLYYAEYHKVEAQPLLAVGYRSLDPSNFLTLIMKCRHFVPK